MKANRKPKRKKMDSDGTVEARMYRYHRLLLETKTEAQTILWFAQFMAYRKMYDSSFR